MATGPLLREDEVVVEAHLEHATARRDKDDVVQVLFELL